MNKSSQPVQPSVSRWLPALFDFPVSAYELEGPGSAHWLLPEELACTDQAVPARVAEFAAGRCCARLAMRSLGAEAQAPLLRGTHREPLWPVALCGSITHTDGYCAAVVARAADCAGLGIDAERTGSVSDDLWPTVFGSDELAALQAQPEVHRPLLATLLFAAKEAFFKCQFPLTRATPDFADVAFRVLGPVAAQGQLALVGVQDEGLKAYLPRTLVRYQTDGMLVRVGASLRHAPATRWPQWTVRRIRT